MLGKILKGLAVAAGVGFAIGLGAGGVVAGKRRRLEQKPASGDSADLRPALERLDGIESRIAAVEARPLSVTESELNLRIQAQSVDIEALRLQMNEYRQRIVSDVAAIQKGLADVTRGLPALLESIVAPRVDDLRIHLQSEMQGSVSAGLTTFERAIDDKVSDRIAALEKVMLDQSGLVTALSHRAIESDMNIERLIAAVERLCDRTNGAAKVSPETPVQRASFAVSGI